MAKKRNTVSEPIVSSGAAPVRTRKHAPAKRADGPVMGASAPTDTIASAATVAENVFSDPLVTTAPAFEEIARLAYSYWEARGCQGGSPEDDWLRAEQELRGNLVNSAQA